MCAAVTNVFKKNSILLIKKKHKTNKKRKNWCQNSNEMQPEFLKTLHFDFQYINGPCLYTEYICYMVYHLATWLILVNEYIIKVQDHMQHIVCINTVYYSVYSSLACGTTYFLFYVISINVTYSLYRRRISKMRLIIHIV